MQISAFRFTACSVLALVWASAHATAGQETFFTPEQAAQIATQQIHGQAILAESLRAQAQARIILDRARIEARSRDREAAAQWSAEIAHARAAHLAATTSSIGGDLSRQMDGMFRVSSEADARKTEAMYEHLTNFHADWAALQNAREERASQQQQQLVAAGLAASGAMTGNPALVAAGAQAAADSTKSSPPIAISKNKGGASPASLSIGQSNTGGASRKSLVPAAASPRVSSLNAALGPSLRHGTRIPIIDDIAERSGAFCGAGNQAVLPPDTGPACYQFYKPDGSPDNTNSACFEHDIALEVSGKRFWQIWDPDVQDIHRRLANAAEPPHFKSLFYGLAGTGRVLNRVADTYAKYSQADRFGLPLP